MDSNNPCSKILYSAIFKWDDIAECIPVGAVIIDKEYINMSGTFFVDVLSPISMYLDIDYYIYELLSYPFLISIQKSVYNLDGVNIFLFTSSIINVRKNTENQNILEILLLTESSDHTSLSHPVLLASDQYDKHKFRFTTNHSECVSIRSNLCVQLWEIVVDIQCPFTFNNEFVFQFRAICNDTNSSLCAKYINTYGSIVSLSAPLAFDDYICDDKVWSIVYNAEMKIYKNGTYTSVTPNVVMAEDRVFVEVIVNDFNVNQNGYSVLNVILLNVWICTSNMTLFMNETNPESSGCLSSDVDQDGPYHIIVDYNRSLTNDARHENETYNNIVRFSFIIPETIKRDELYIQTQISMEFSENVGIRRLLATSDDEKREATQMIYGSRSVTLTRDEIKNVDVGDTKNDDYVYIIIVVSIFV